MSRLIVKNLPAYLSDVRLREHFSQRGLVTDVKLMTRPDGTSRRFGFVGYRTDQEAQEALEYFNRTFIDTSRIQVEAARKIDDEELAQKRERRLANRNDGAEVTRSGASSDASTSKLPAASDEAPKPPKKSKKDRAAEAKSVSFEEFMAVMAPKKKRKTWANEDEDQEARFKASTSAEDERSAKKAKKREDKAKSLKEEVSSSLPATDNEASASTDPPPDEREATPDEALNDEGLTDLDYMHRRMKRNVASTSEQPSQDQTKQFEQSDSEEESDEEGDSESESEDDQDTQERLEKERLAREEAARKDQEAVDTIMLSGRLFVRNLPFAATEDDLAAHFETYGPIKQTHIPLDKASKTSKGMAFVSFEEAAHALAAYRGADGSTFQGRLLHLLPAVDLRPPPDAPKTLKQSRSDERKAKADKDFNWSMLYMSADAVASSVSDRLGVSKSDILNPSEDSKGDSAAVRLALAETRVIQETKEFLENEGVNVAAFDETSLAAPNKKKTRSDTTILVKNIPYGTTSETVRQLFESHGEVERVLVPPTGTLALVEMAIAGEARVAFKALAYRRLGNSVLYLEKAPIGVMSSSKKSADDATGAVVNGKPSVVAPPSKQDARLGAGTGSEADAEPGATLFVKNLSFATTDTKLAALFGTLQDFAFARVQTRTDSRDPSKRLSMGYGFVGYRSVEAAQSAVSVLNGKDLDGHSLSLSFARRGQDADDAAAAASGKGKRGSDSTKLVVKNLPFEATKKDVRALFGSYGQLKSVRVPRKAAPIAGAAGGGARGFAFVEFTSPKEASAALSALRHTHLLGRHLVIAYDDEDSKGVEGMREKVKQGFDIARDAGMKARVRKEKLKLGEEDIAEAARKERESDKSTAGRTG